jgi:hypothetical protein
MPMESENGGKGHYIILAVDGYHGEPNVGNPVRAESPRDALEKRGMLGYERIRVYQLREKPTGDCEYWDQDDFDN